MSGAASGVLSVPLDALSRDATRWDETAAVLSELGSMTEVLPVWEAYFSFAGHGVCAAYLQVIEAVRGYLAEGVRRTTDTAEELRAVRHAYESTDHTARARFTGAWDPQSS